MAESDDPGRLARDAYTYLHLPIVAGVIAVAVADELLIAHPGEPFETAGVAMVLGGPALFLLGETLFRVRMIGSANRQAGDRDRRPRRCCGRWRPACRRWRSRRSSPGVLTALALWEYEPLRARAATG